MILENELYARIKQEAMKVLEALKRSQPLERNSTAGVVIRIKIIG
jgi:hypothetical protein